MAQHSHSFEFLTPSGRPVCWCGFEQEGTPAEERAALGGHIDEEEEPYPGQRGPCARHSWVYTGSACGGDDESYMGEGRCYCEYCGADGDA